MTTTRLTTVLTDALRAEHQHLRERVDELAEAATALQSGSEPDLGELVTWLAQHLIPHARAEEVVLYPAVDTAAGSPQATATMRIDHEEIVTRLEGLARAVDDDRVVPAFVPMLTGLHAIVLLHLRKEEEVLLPLLDEHLDSTEAEQLLAALQAAAHDEEA